MKENVQKCLINKWMFFNKISANIKKYTTELLIFFQIGLKFSNQTAKRILTYVVSSTHHRKAWRIVSYYLAPKSRDHPPNNGILIILTNKNNKSIQGCSFFNNCSILLISYHWPCTDLIINKQCPEMCFFFHFSFSRYTHNKKKRFWLVHFLKLNRFFFLHSFIIIADSYGESKMP